ncbi:hypothetical protein BDP81DRAFT_427274 [Colletotrichum phormii]|uniref:Uncharacterized protein n=1 Tax=Colletotrichum phormii TaxID=359342 RepID=A0AAI9ZSE0_9PEZI|nr:uncharacterized protein BDP81DRAFT_427274 [Colletotrichum phormii]KAK1637340.1 hypothetical protein BDP81DRAFT_427274 [Colletotrichum phormii]
MAYTECGLRVVVSKVLGLSGAFFLFVTCLKPSSFQWVAWPLSNTTVQKKIIPARFFFHWTTPYILPISGNRMFPVGRHIYTHSHEPKIRLYIAHRHWDAQQLKLPASVARSWITCFSHSLLLELFGTSEIHRDFQLVPCQDHCHFASLSPFCQTCRA